MMNERIWELWNHATLDPTNEDSSDLIRKFAELIVQDCCDTIREWKNEPFPFDEDVAVSIIKEHFGVK